MLTVRTIQPRDWPAIMAIQQECYHLFDPEPLEVMQSKTVLAPDCCWVAERRGKVQGYLLCHPWRACEPPPLSVPMQRLAGNEEFYLHDLAIAREARGLGVGQKLFVTALDFARHEGYSHLGLVAVQDAPAFWGKLGFEPCATRKPLEEYGEGAVYMRLSLAGSACCG